MAGKKIPLVKKKFRAPLERSTNKLWGSHVRVPSRIVQEVASEHSRRITCRLNNCEPFQCAILPYATGVFVISVNKKLCGQLGIRYGDQIDVIIRKDDSVYGLPFPEELAELFIQDREANGYFHALTRGKQRTLLYMVGSVKDPDKRLRRSVLIARHLKENKGSINYRQLLLALRDPRKSRRDIVR